MKWNLIIHNTPSLPLAFIQAHMTNVTKARTTGYVHINDTPETCENGLLFIMKLVSPTLSIVLGIFKLYNQQDGPASINMV
jgi:hypothetical protein